MKRIKLTQNKYALVDNQDYEWLNKYSWHLHGEGYAYTWLNNREKILMHRLILNAKPNEITDHINWNRLDNRIKNLRICTHSQNHHNSGLFSHNTSGYRGVGWWRPGRLWRARIIIRGKEIIKYFNKKSMAIKCRKQLESMVWQSDT